MSNIFHYLFLAVCALLATMASAQTYTTKVIDGATGKPIPFATIQTGEHSGTVTNEEGIFTLALDRLPHPQDSIYVSSMGYGKLGLILGAQTGETITLQPKEFELKQVFLSNENLSPEEIIDRVKENMAANYAVELSQKKIFFRQSDFNKMDRFNIEFKKSTIEELNKNLIDSIVGLVPKGSSYYREAVGDFYGDYSTHKFYVDKAAELYDKSKDVSMDGLSEKMEGIFKENVKPDSYLKIKSGIFGTKVQLDSLAEANEEEAGMIQVENTDDQIFQEQIKSRISNLYEQLFFQEDSELDMLSKSNRYRFELTDYTFIDDAPVYILSFVPKGRKDFQGVMYVNTEDFAIVRLEFDNVRPTQKFALLGISFRRSIYRGKMLFGKDANGSYSVRYMEVEDGNTFGLDRPLKVIEKNKHVKGRRKQNELSLGLDIGITQLEKFEMVVFETKTISQSDYEGVKENPKVKATYLSQYDPNFWAGHAIMEPNAAIQAFKVVE